MLRVEDTVRRPWKPWSDAVGSLLAHLESKGFAGAPRWQGRDDDGREVLTYVEGHVPDYPLDVGYWSDAALVGAARLLRDFHDATVDMVGADLAWRFGYPGSCAVEVICHNDIAPYNTVYERGLPKAFIDFDTAGPGPRVWDVSYAAYRFVPLMPPDDYEEHSVPDGLDISRRLAQFCRAYGRYAGDLMDELVLRLQTLRSHIRTEAQRGVPWHVANLDQGHVELYERHIGWLRAQRNLLRQALEESQGPPP